MSSYTVDVPKTNAGSLDEYLTVEAEKLLDTISSTNERQMKLTWIKVALLSERFYGGVETYAHFCEQFVPLLTGAIKK